MSSPVVYITLLGMFLSSLLFFYNEGYKSANSYLSGFLFLSSLFVFIQYVFIFSHDVDVIIWFVAGFPSLFYLIGPFAFFYVRSILRDNARLSKGDYLHFILCFMVLLGAIPYIISDMEHKLTLARYIVSNDWSAINYRPNAIFPPVFNRTLRPIHLMVYSILIWVTIYQYRVKLFRSRNHSSDFQTTKKWLLVFSGFVPLMALFHVFIFYGTTLADTKAIFILESYPLLVAFSAVYVAMIASLLLFPHVIYGLPAKTYLPSEKLISQPVGDYSPIKTEFENRPKEVEDIQPSGPPAEKFVQLFSEVYLDEIKSKLQVWTEQMQFLDSDTTISTLAVQIKIPQHHLSYYFNTILEIKFTDWRNNLKIEYAISLLEQGLNKSLTLEAIGIQCGYMSQSTFIRAFKNAKGMTPTEYIKWQG
jgi:AraC-like DNA-binding protein